MARKKVVKENTQSDLVEILNEVAKPIPAKEEELKKGIEESELIIVLSNIGQILLMIQKDINILASVQACNHTPKLKPGYKYCSLCKVRLIDPAISDEQGNPVSENK